MTIRNLLADDHKIVISGLRSLIEREEDMQVIGMAEDGGAAVRLTKELAPDVVIMDIGMPVLNGIEATRQISAEHPEVKIIGLSMHSDRQTVMEMLNAGALSYLLKECAFEDLVRAVRSVAQNRIYLPPSLVKMMTKD